MEIFFAHEKLKVYQLSRKLVSLVDEIMLHQPKKISACDNLERASTSLALNIAEGNGIFTSKDRCSFFDIAKGSALEYAGGLDILYRKKLISPDVLMKGKKLLQEIVSMIIGLIKSNSDRLYEPMKEYGS